MTLTSEGEPERFLVLLEGKPGIGGVYDLWRHGRAMLRGRSFNPAHREPVA